MDEGTVRAILESIEWLGSVGTSGDSHVSCRCLMMHKHPKGYDSHPSTTVSFGDIDSWVECFSCGYKNKLEKTLYQLVEDNRISADIAVGFTRAKKNNLVLEPRIRTTVIQDCTIPMKELRKNEYGKNMLEFLRSRSVPVEVAKLMGLAYVPEGHSDEWMGEDREGNPKVTPREGIAIPVMAKVDGKFICVGAQMRMFDVKFRYYALYKFSAQLRLFGEQLLPKVAGKDVFLVEGPFDVLAILAKGFMAFGLYGTKVSKEKALLIKEAGVRMVHVLLDPDDAGEKGTIRADKVLKEFGIPYILHESSKDPKKHTSRELRELTEKVL